MPITDDVLALLAAPGGRGPLRLVGDACVAADGRRFPVERGVLRTLGEVDPLLARELAAQASAVGDYLDEHLLMPRYEHHIARMAVEELFGADPAGADAVHSAVLDAGCGVGLLGRLYPRLGLVGLDASLPLLEQATTGYRVLVEGSAEALPFRDGAFDAVLALNMLHHVIRPEAAVAEFARVLRPGGVLVTVDPRKVAPIELAKRLLRRHDHTFAPTHKAFDVAEYAGIVSGGGAFAIEEQRRIGLAGLVGMAGLDALRLSRLLPSADRAVDLFRGLDAALFRLPAVERAGLNLATRARRV